MLDSPCEEEMYKNAFIDGFTTYYGHLWHSKNVEPEHKTESYRIILFSKQGNSRIQEIKFDDKTSWKDVKNFYSFDYWAYEDDLCLDDKTMTDIVSFEKTMKEFETIT